MHNLKRKTLDVDFSHLRKFNQELADGIQDNYYRVESYLRRSIATIKELFYPQDLQRPLEEKREYWISFRNLSDSRKLRYLKTEQIGRLITINGTVTRTSDVKPELYLGYFTCLECMASVDAIEQQFKYTEPVRCTNPECANIKRWQLDLERSIFIDWQRVRVQENANEIPPGSMPRSIDIIFRNDTVEQAKAGDQCFFTGSLMVVPEVHKMFTERVESRQVQVPDRNNTTTDPRQRTRKGWVPSEGVTGLKVLGVRDLNYKLCFLCNNCQMIGGSSKDEESRQDTLTNLSTQEISKVLHMSKEKDIFNKLSTSLAPNIFGHEDVKKGLLIMLFGGVHKKTMEGINLRGDINVMIVGDPSTSKSQFLKYVSALLPRGVYTSGKASTSAGLTASVVRDLERGEFAIEAGALMLADNGICCIDEFDKMDVKDQVAIHESMEQQTISIAKAGIRATLNARTSILAAANPIGGRYNPKKTLKANLGITPAIMSRFDLFFVVQDECNPDIDRNIAKHIVHVHQSVQSTNSQLIAPYYSMEDLKLYIRYCKEFKPKLTPEAKKILIDSYRKLRQSDKIGLHSYRITVRQLEALIRISEAIAKIHCEELITEIHVAEAVKLLKLSISKVDKDPVILEQDDSYWEESRKKNQRKMHLQLVDELKVRRLQKNEELKRAEQEMEAHNKLDLETTVDDILDDAANDAREQRRQFLEEAIVEITLELEELNKRVKEMSEQVPEEENEEEAPRSKKKKVGKSVQLSYEEYRKISNNLIRGMSKFEDGISKTDLINWYIKHMDIPADEDDTVKQVKLLKKIIDKLVSQDNVFIDLDVGTEKDDMDHLLIRHPNFVENNE